MKAKYHIIERVLYQRMKDGTYAAGSRLPTEQELAEEFEVNRHTLRRAIGLLVDRGFIDRAPRRGCVVAKRPGRPEQRQTITWFQSPDHFQGYQQELTQLKSHFETSHPQYTLDIRPFTRGTTLTPLLPEATAQGACLVSVVYAAGYAAAGKLAALDAFDDFHTMTKALEGRLLQTLAGPDGSKRIYALPRCMGVWMMLANRTLLQELGLGDGPVPDSWEELRRLGERVAAASNGQVCLMDYEFHLWPQSFARFIPWFLNANGGQQLIDPERGTVHFDTPDNRALLRYLRELLDAGVTRIGSLLDGFVQRRSIAAASLTQGGFCKAPQWLPGDTFEAWPFPRQRPTDHPHTLMRGESIGVLAQSLRCEEDREAAWTLLRFLISKEIQQERPASVVTLPVRTDAAFALKPDSPERTFLDFGMTYGQPMFDVIRLDDVHHVLCSTMARFLDGGDLDYLMPQAQELLEHYLSDHPTPDEAMPMVAEAFA